MKIERILRLSVTGGLFLVTLVPLVVTFDLYHPFTTGKNFAFRILVEIVFGLWLVLVATDPRCRPRGSWPLASLLALLLVAAVANLAGVDPGRGFWGDLRWMGGFVNLLHLVAFFLVLGTMLRGEKQWLIYGGLTAGVGLVVSLFGVAQLVGLYPVWSEPGRLDALAGHATRLAPYVLFNIYIVVLLAMRLRARIGKRIVWAAGAVVPLHVVVLFHTGTRSTIAGFALSVLAILLAILVFERGKPVLRRGALALLVVSALLAGGGIALRDQAGLGEHPVIERFSETSLSADGTQARWLVWPMAIEAFLERPLLGRGQDGFTAVYGRLYDPRVRDRKWFDRPHNVPLEWLVDTGLLGLLAYLSIPAALLFTVWRKRGGSRFPRREAALISALLLAYLVHGFFLFDTILSYLPFVSLLAWVHARTTEAGEPAGKPRFVLGRGPAHALLLPLLVAGTVLAAHALNWGGIRAAYQLQRAEGEAADVRAKLSHYRQTLDVAEWPRRDVAGSYFRFAMTLSTRKADAALRGEVARLGAALTQPILAASPEDVRNTAYLGAQLSRLGAHEAGMKYLLAAHERSPRMQWTMREIAHALTARGDTTGGLTWHERAFAAAPERDDERVRYAAALLRGGRIEEAGRILVARFGTPTPAYAASDQLLGAYGSLGRWDLARDIWRARVALAPKGISAYVRLAVAELRLDRREDAVRAILAAMRRDPSFRARGAALVRRIRAGQKIVIQRRDGDGG